MHPALQTLSKVRPIGLAQMQMQAVVSMWAGMLKISVDLSSRFGYYDYIEREK
jgi:hypothetical protein